MKEQNCEHVYESRVQIVRERFNIYQSNSRYDTGTLEQERHYLFCNKCGDIKSVNLPLHSQEKKI